MRRWATAVDQNGPRWPPGSICNGGRVVSEATLALSFLPSALLTNQRSGTPTGAGQHGGQGPWPSWAVPTYESRWVVRWSKPDEWHGSDWLRLTHPVRQSLTAAIFSGPSLAATASAIDAPAELPPTLILFTSYTSGWAST